MLPLKCRHLLGAMMKHQHVTRAREMVIASARFYLLLLAEIDTSLVRFTFVGRNGHSFSKIYVLLMEEIDTASARFTFCYWPKWTPPQQAKFVGREVEVTHLPRSSHTRRVG